MYLAQLLYLLRTGIQDLNLRSSQSARFQLETIGLHLKPGYDNSTWSSDLIVYDNKRVEAGTFSAVAHCTNDTLSDFRYPGMYVFSHVYS